MNGSRGRMDGGVGLTIREPTLLIKLKERNKGLNVTFRDSKNLDSNLIEDYTQKIKTSAINILKYLNKNSGFEFIVEKTFPVHSGLGSGTQLSLATAKLICELYQISMTSYQIGKIVGRGGTSGIGVAAFDQGGFIVDGGHKIEEKKGFLPSSASKAAPPPIITRYDFPEDWNIILAIPDIQDRISGSKELNIFQKYCPIPLREVETISHLILMKMMPAVIEKDLDNFGEAINEIQNTGFKKVEMDLQNKIIPETIESMRKAGAAGAGMSSFGPTIYGITDTDGHQIIKAIREALGETKGLIFTTKAQNSGAQID